jgi:hypothetical protein
LRSISLYNAEVIILVKVLDRLLALKRYDAGAGYDLYTYGDENEEGNWVKWEDIEEIVNELAQEAQELEHCHD